MACDKCEGKGKIQYRTLGDALPTDIGNGLSVQAMGGWSTRACECVRDLPATDGKATWWESETIYAEVVTIPIGCEAVEITADCEIPRGPDGRRYHRTAENAYYPPLIRLDLECAATLHSDTAREIAAALTAAADACDAADALAVSTAPPQMSRFVSCPSCGESDTIYYWGEWRPADWPGGPALCGCPSSGYEFGPCEPAAT